MLQNQMSQTERDTLEVISYLKQEDMKKDDQVRKLNKIMFIWGIYFQLVLLS